METPYQTERYTLGVLSEEEPFPASMARASERYGKEIERVLREEGFSKITATKDKSDISPRFLAVREGRKACICFAPLAESSLAVDHLSKEQCDHCDREYSEYDVYYACIFEGHLKKIELLGPMIVKRDGQWLNDDLTYSQYLPISMRDGIGRYSTIFNGAVLFKLQQEIIPITFYRPHAPTFTVKNLFECLNQGESGHLAFCLFDSPTLIFAVRKSDEDNSFIFERPLFLNCDGERSELELVSMPAEADPEDGLVELMESQGTTLLAECPEVLLYRNRMQTSRRYLWHLSMVAGLIETVGQEISITSGPLFELEKQQYREEHGCEPPDDFAFTVSTGGMRSFAQEDHGTYASVTGEVTSIESTFVNMQPMTILTICPFADNEDVHLQVFVSPEILDQYKPEPGDTILAAGHIYASADELLTDAPSWQDSPEPGETMQKREDSFRAYAIYEHFARYSMGHAVAASAFVGAGWDVLPPDIDDLYAHDAVLTAIAQDGSSTVVAVDTVINGRKPKLSHEGIDKLSDPIDGELPSCCRCIVHLDYNQHSDAYKVTMELEPAIPGVECNLVYTRNPIRETILSFENGGEAHEKRLRPEKLDESMVSHLFLEAMAHGKWGNFAEWVREEASYVSESCKNIAHEGKLSLLRYFNGWITARKKDIDVPWSAFSFSTGKVLYKGEYRPCTAMHYHGIPTALTIFDDARGLVGHMHNVSPDCFCYYKQDTPMIRTDAGSEDEPDIALPPHGAETACDCGLPRSPELQRVIDLLTGTNNTVVYCDLDSGLLPHLWFRDPEGRLCRAILCDSDQNEEAMREIDASLENIQHYPGFIIRTNADDGTPIRMLPIREG